MGSPPRMSNGVGRALTVHGQRTAVHYNEPRDLGSRARDYGLWTMDQGLAWTMDSRRSRGQSTICNLQCLQMGGDVKSPRGLRIYNRQSAICNACSWAGMPDGQGNGRNQAIDNRVGRRRMKRPSILTKRVRVPIATN